MRNLFFILLLSAGEAIADGIEKIKEFAAEKHSRKDKKMDFKNMNVQILPETQALLDEAGLKLTGNNKSLKSILGQNEDLTYYRKAIQEAEKKAADLEKQARESYP